MSTAWARVNNTSVRRGRAGAYSLALIFFANRKVVFTCDHADHTFRLTLLATSCAASTMRFGAVCVLPVMTCFEIVHDAFERAAPLASEPSVH